jgi:hypothetical protein
MKTKLDSALIERDKIKAKLGKAVLQSESNVVMPGWVSSQIDRLLFCLQSNELYINSISNNGHSTNPNEVLSPLNTWSREAILADCKAYYQVHGDIFNKS